jgi:hypothetical protein
MQWVKDFFASLFVPFEQWQEQRFLSAAVDLSDLEWRMKEIAHGRFRSSSLSWG